MAKKWYNLFVSVERPDAAPDEQPPPGSAAQTVAEIAASIAPQPTFTAPVANPTSFAEIYDAAEIRPPAHGFTILKVADLLQSEHIRTLPREVKRSSVMLALEATGANIQEVIEDAVRRDRALDTFERVQQKSVEEMEARKTQENQQIQAELDRLAAEYRARMQANSDAIAKEKERFFAWRLQKQEEEQKIADAVSYFVTDNPITTRNAATAPAPNPPVSK